MTDLIQLITDNTRWLVGGTLGLFGVVVAAEWKLMDGWRTFWKDAFTEKDKKLKNFKKKSDRSSYGYSRDL